MPWKTGGAVPVTPWHAGCLGEGKMTKRRLHPTHAASLLALLALAACSASAPSATPLDEGDGVEEPVGDETPPPPSTPPVDEEEDVGPAPLTLTAPAEVLTYRDASAAFVVELGGAAWDEVDFELVDVPEGVSLSVAPDASEGLVVSAAPDSEVGDYEVTLRASMGDRVAEKSLVLTVAGAPGTLDTTFGNGGALALTVHWPAKLLRDPEGRLLALFELGTLVQVARIRWDGTLDPTFDDDGVANVSFDPNALFQYAHSFATLPEGDLVVLGGVGADSNNLTRCLVRLDPAGQRTGLDGDGRVCLPGVTGRIVRPFGEDAFLVSGSAGSVVGAWKVGSTGQLDLAFGDGDGMIQYDPGAQDYGHEPLFLDNGFLLPTSTNSNFYLTRFDRKGDLMTTFGEGGTVGFYGHAVRKLEVSADSRLFVTTVKSGTRHGLVIDSTGKGDPSVGVQGELDLSTLPLEYAFIHPSDRADEIFVTSYIEDKMYLSRIDRAGTLDTAFGEGGMASVQGESAVSVVDLPRGRVATYNEAGKVLRFWR